MDDINSTLNRLLQASDPDNTQAAGEIRHGFRVAGSNLLLPQGTPCELASRQNICHLPDCPPWFSGFINHRGHAVPIYDLDCFFAESDPTPPVNRDFWILLLGSHPGTAGFIIHALPSVLSDLSPDEPGEEDSLPPDLYRLTTAAWRRGDERWYEIDPGALLEQLKARFQTTPKQ